MMHLHEREPEEERMSTTDGGGTTEPDVSPEEVERLRGEVDELQHKVDTLADRPARPHRVRQVTAVILVILTVISLALAVPGTWLRRTTQNSDRYVATVGPLAQDPAIQEYMARTITDEVFTALGVQERLAAALQAKAPQLVFLAAPITTSVKGFVQDQVLKLVQTQAFQDLWIQANRFAQSQIVAILQGKGSDLVGTANGQVVLNLLPIVNQALTQVSQVASDLLGRPITLPTITADELPADAIAKIEAATGVTLPSNFGQLVVVDSQELASVQDGFSIANRLVYATLILFALLFIAAMWVSVRRRRTLIQILSASALVLVVERRAFIHEASAIVNAVKPENQAAAQAVVNALKGSLLRYTGWLLAIAVVGVLIALITGPYPWAVTFRGWVRDLFGAIVGAAKGADRSAAGAWVAAHRDPLLMVGGAVFILLVLVLNLNWVGFLVLAVLAAAYGFGVWRVAGTQSDPEMEPSADPAP
jgi:hypothetical protein